LATLVVKYVDTGGAGDYSSLAAWEAAQQQDLVANDRAMQVFCSASTGVADTTNCLISGWTTDGSHFIHIYGTPTGALPEAWSTSLYRLVTSGSPGLTVAEDQVVFWGVQFESTVNYATLVHLTVSGNNAGFYRCKFRIPYGGAGLVVNNGANLYAGYCILTGAGGGSSGIYMPNPTVSGAAYAHNCLVKGCYRGYFNNSTGQPFEVINCVAQGCSDGFTGTFSGSNNCSDVGSDAPGTGARTGSPEYFDYAGGNFRLKTLDTVAKGYGIDDGWSFLGGVDHVGYTESSPYDIGPITAHADPLITQESSHLQYADAFPFTQEHRLPPQDGYHVQDIEGNFPFTQDHFFELSDANHEHLGGEPAVDVSIQLYVQDTDHAIDTAEFAFVHIRVFYPDGTVHEHRAKNVKLTQVHNLVDLDAWHEHIAGDGIDVNIRVNLVVQDASHSVDSEELLLNVIHELEIQGGVMLHWTTLLNSYTYQEHVRVTKVILTVTKSANVTNVTPQKYAENVTTLKTVTSIDTTV